MDAVLVIWWTTLVVAAVVVLPTVWYLLHRLLRAARAIERYAADTLAAGAGIAQHTAAVSALETTGAVVRQLLTGASAIATSAAAIEQALGRQRLEGGRR